jgi:hypothetical protein
MLMALEAATLSLQHFGQLVLGELLVAAKAKLHLLWRRAMIRTRTLLFLITGGVFAPFWIVGPPRVRRSIRPGLLAIIFLVLALATVEAGIGSE